MGKLIVWLIKAAINIALLPVLFVAWVLSSFTDWLVAISGIPKHKLPKRNRAKAEEQDFVYGVANASEDCLEAFPFLNEQDDHELKLRATKTFLERTEQHKDYKPSDYYFEALFGALKDIAEQNLVPHDQNARTYYVIDNFFKNNHHYFTPIAMSHFFAYDFFLRQNGFLSS